MQVVILAILKIIHWIGIKESGNKLHVIDDGHG